jgi:hypothetical protein
MKKTMLLLAVLPFLQTSCGGEAVDQHPVGLCCFSDAGLFVDGERQTNGCACGECYPDPPFVPACTAN